MKKAAPPRPPGRKTKARASGAVSGMRSPDSGNLRQGRIVVAVDEEKGPEAAVSGHFWRCPYYALVEVAGNRIAEWKTVANPYCRSIGDPGMIPGFMHELGADAILAGSVGGRALKCFEDFGIDVVAPVEGRAGEAVEGYLRGAMGTGASRRGQDGR